jgi:hypothetical protein
MRMLRDGYPAKRPFRAERKPVQDNMDVLGNVPLVGGMKNDLSASGIKSCIITTIGGIETEEFSLKIASDRHDEWAAQAATADHPADRWRS